MMLNKIIFLGIGFILLFFGCNETNRGTSSELFSGEVNANSMQATMQPKVLLDKEFAGVLHLDIPDYPPFSMPKIVYMLKGEIGGKEQRAYLIVRKMPLGSCFDYSLELQIKDYNQDDWYDNQKLAENANLYAIANKSRSECVVKEQESISKNTAKSFTFDTINTALLIGLENNALLLEGIWRDDASNAFFPISKDSPFYGQSFSFRQDKDLPVNVFAIAGESLSFVQAKGVVNNPRLLTKRQEYFYFGGECFDWASSITSNVCADSYPNTTKYYYKDIFIASGVSKGVINRALAYGAESLQDLREKRKNEIAQFANNIASNKETEYYHDFVVRYIDSKILVLEELYSAMEQGDAHPISTIGIRIYDIASGAKLSSQLQDLFLLGFNTIQSEVIKQKLLDLLTKKLQAQYGELVFQEQLPLVMLPKIFAFTNKGVEFIWQPYEIAPYSSGIIRVQVDFAELREYVDFASVYSYLF